jgi:hypothetical protein
MADPLKIVLDDATEGRDGALLLSRFGKNLIGFLWRLAASTR